MKLALLLLAAAALAAAPAAAQTIKSLGFNTTNGNVVYSGTNALTFTNALSFGTNAAITRTNLGLAQFKDAAGDNWAELYDNGELRLAAGNTILFYEAFDFGGTNAAEFRGQSRISLGLGLPALTQTSNATMMRALAGSTNTNEPFSGSISLTNTNTLVFSNGILLSQ